MAELNLREMTFQNVVDQILKPNGVKVGGFPEDMFLEISDKESETYLCNICFLVLKEARECTNKHHFCHTCIFAWTLTYGPNSQKCPVCRNPQQRYRESFDVNKVIQDKRVRCHHEGCTYKSPLKFFLYHSHGKERFSNAHVDLESLRPQRSSPNSIFFLPQLSAAGGSGQRISHMRSSLEQGRTMIHQMVFLLHLEMQLRQRSLVNMSVAQNASNRLARLDEVLALNEQLNEVGTILTSMMSEPLISRGAAAASGAEEEGSSSTRSGTGLFNSREYYNNNIDSDSDSDTSEASTIVSRVRPFNPQNNTSGTTLRSSSSTGSGLNRNRPNRSSNLTSTANLQTIQRIPQSSITTNRQSIDHFAEETTTVTVSSSLNTTNPRRMLAGNTNELNSEAVASSSTATSNTSNSEIQPNVTNNRRVLDRGQVQNTLTSDAVVNESNRISSVPSSNSINTRPNSTLPPIEPQPTSEQETDTNLPQGSDTFSRTIRELNGAVDHIQTDHNQNNPTPQNNNNREGRIESVTSAVPRSLSRPNSVSRRETSIAGTSQINRVENSQVSSSATPSSSSNSSSSDSICRSNISQRQSQGNNEESRNNQQAITRPTRERETSPARNETDARSNERNEVRISQQRDNANNHDTGAGVAQGTSETRLTGDRPSPSSTRTSNAGTFAPQKRFRRQSDAAINTSNTTTRTSRKLPTSNDNANKVPAKRRTSVPNSRSRRTNQSTNDGNNNAGRLNPGRPNASEVPRNLIRNVDSSGESNSNSSSGTQRTRKQSTDRPRGPATAGQLIRARRRSEIMQELQSLKNDEED